MHEPVVQLSINKLYLIMIGGFVSLFLTIVIAIATWSLKVNIEYVSTMPTVINRIENIEYRENMAREDLIVRTKDRWDSLKEAAQNRFQTHIDEVQNSRLDGLEEFHPPRPQSNL